MLSWVPSVNFTVSGRILCGFTDNPEVIAAAVAAWEAYAANPIPDNIALYKSIVRQLGSLKMFPVNTPAQMAIPTRLRRKRFDVNRGLVQDSVDQNDRCTQVAFLWCTEGVALDAGSFLGSFEYSDVVHVEGVTPRLT